MDWTLSGGVPCVSLISLGTLYEDKYYISDDCLECLGEIEKKLSSEDSSTRSMRRAFGFMDVLNKDFIPILLWSKEKPAIFRAVVKILVELSVPVECLTSETPSKSPFSTYVLHDLTQLLHSIKEAFLDPRAVRSLIDHLNYTMDKKALLKEDCDVINCLLLLVRNILHAPERPPRSMEEEAAAATQEEEETYYSHLHGPTTAGCSQQNQLLWNLFTQGFDRVLIHLLSSSQKEEWTVPIVQLIALFYKDQYVESMQKLLGSWLESTTTSNSDSDTDEDNESNTSPLNDACTSPQLLTSDSSDYAKKDAAKSSPPSPAGESVEEITETRPPEKKSTRKIASRHSVTVATRETCAMSTSSSGFHSSFSSDLASVQASIDLDQPPAKECLPLGKNVKRPHAATKKRSDKALAADASGGTSSSSPDIEPAYNRPQMKHAGAMGSIGNPPEKEQRRKKLYKHSRSMGPKKLKRNSHYVPNEENVSQLIKEFTVDFLLHGYNTLVGTLHHQLIHGEAASLDKSHFLWLISYFIRIASQLEVDVKHLSEIFTVDLLSHLTWEAVMETELFAVASLVETSDLKPCLRRLHLGVTAIREYLQALETYSRLTHLCDEDRKTIMTIHSALPLIRDLRQVFVMQLRHFNPAIQSRHYLRDIITSNHVLILTIERAKAVPNMATSKGSFDIHEHLTQFCNKTIMNRYGTALEDFQTNGPFVNDCIMTILHHVGTGFGRVDLLCQPLILRSFSKMWEEEFNMCDDWNDLIEFVVQKFLRNFNLRNETSRSGSKCSASPSQSIAVDSPQSAMETDQNSDATENIADPPPPPPSPPSSPSLALADATDAGDVGDPTFPTYESSLLTVESLKGQLMDSGFEKQLCWIQRSLLEMCSARLGTFQGREYQYPIATLCLKMNVACPIVPWTDTEALGLKSEQFIYLLHRIGLLPANNGGLFPRIPCEWDCNALYTVACFFGPVDETLVDFDLTRVKEVNLPIPQISDDQPLGLNVNWRPSYLGPGPSKYSSAMPHHWLHWVEQSGGLLRSAEGTSQIPSSHSVCNFSLKPMDSVSTTSSLEVHKTDSSDNEEMEEELFNHVSAGGTVSLISSDMSSDE